MFDTRTQPARPPLLQYAVVTSILGATVVAILRTLDATDATQIVQGSALVPPIAAMLGLTLVVFSLMVVVRNLLVAIGKVSMRYYHSYTIDPPSEAIERPARTFNNLMELPSVFYAVCLLSISLNHVDAATVQLAWMFVALRAVHAIVMIGWSVVPYRFAVYAASSIVLVTLAFRVLTQVWPAG